MSLGVVESLRFGLYNVTYVAFIMLALQTVVIYTAAARRKRRLKHATKQQGPTTGTGGAAAINIKYFRIASELPLLEGRSGVHCVDALY